MMDSGIFVRDFGTRIEEIKLTNSGTIIIVVTSKYIFDYGNVLKVPK